MYSGLSLYNHNLRGVMNPGIECLFFLEKEKIKKIELSLTDHPGISWKLGHGNHQGKVVSQINQWMETYISGKHADTCLPLDLSGLQPFTLRVLNELQMISFGKSCSYFEIATKLSKPQASRAVGQACGRNPFPLIIPCHRVLSKNQKLGGFSCGLEIKKILLRHENISF